LVRFL